MHPLAPSSSHPIRLRQWLALPLALSLGGLLVALLFALLPAGGAAAAPPADPATTYPCSLAGLNSALAAGGAATFTCGAPTTVTVTSGPRVVNKNVSLDGGNKLILSGGGITGVFTVAAGIHLSLLNLTVRDGRSYGGAGVYNNGFLAVTHTHFISNEASLGAAVLNAPSAVASLFDSTFEMNIAEGGAVWNGSSGITTSQPATTTVVNSTFLDNRSIEGSAIFNYLGLLTVSGSTFSNNTANSGGAIYNNATLRLDSSRFMFNAAGSIVIDSQAQLLDQASGLALPAGSSANGMGGAINATLLANTLIASSSFTQNLATAGGGAVFNGALPPAPIGPFPNLLSISGSTFVDNCSGGAGGALNTSQSATVSDSSFQYNFADSNSTPCVSWAASHPGTRAPAHGPSAPALLVGGLAGAGGAIFNSGVLAVKNVDFLGNTATVTTTGGGGAIANYLGSLLTIDIGAFTDNSAFQDGGAIYNDTSAVASVGASSFTHNTAQNDSGAAVANLGVFTVTQSLFTRNYGALSQGNLHGGGGAIFSNNGPILAVLSPGQPNGVAGQGPAQAPQVIGPANRLFVDHTQFISNSSEFEGGAIDGGITAIHDSTFLSNTAAYGGALDVLQTNFAVSGSTFIANAVVTTTLFAAAEGGAIDANGEAMTVLNSTFFANLAPAGAVGGAINGNGASLWITNSTFVSNTAVTAGFGGALSENGSFHMANDLLAYNAGGNCEAVVPLDAHNIDYPGVTCGGPANHGNPLALAPANNGGPTLTSALLPGSPAINAGNDSGCPATDQRGAHRPVGAHCDIGAFEFGGSVPWLWLPLIHR